MAAVYTIFINKFKTKTFSRPRGGFQTTIAFVHFK